MSIYTDFKAKVLAMAQNKQHVGDGECVSLIVNNSNAYVEALYPGVNWTSIIAPVPDARLMAGKSNSYLTWIANDHNNPNQLPVIGDIGISDGTPKPGYSNTTDNPAGHCWVFDSSINPAGFNGLQQNSPAYGNPANVKYFDWKFRPVLGWYHPTNNQPAPPQPPVYSGKSVYLPPTTGPWHLYNVGGPYNPNGAYKGLLVPSQFGGLTYKIVNDRGNGVYTINTQMYGQGDIWTSGSDVVVS